MDSRAALAQRVFKHRSKSAGTAAYSGNTGGNDGSNAKSQFTAGASGEHCVDCVLQVYSPNVGETLVGLQLECLQLKRWRNVEWDCNLTVYSGNSGGCLERLQRG